MIQSYDQDENRRLADLLPNRDGISVVLVLFGSSITTIFLLKYIIGYLARVLA